MSQTLAATLRFEDSLSFEAERDIWTNFVFLRDPKNQLQVFTSNLLASRAETASAGFNWTELLDVRFLV